MLKAAIVDAQDAKKRYKSRADASRRPANRPR